eukprot:gene22792-31088_t
MNGPEDTRLRNMEASKDELLKVITLKDDVAKLEYEITSKNTEISKLKNVIAYQADKIHQVTLNEEKVTFTYKERFRKFEKEKNSLKNQTQGLMYEYEELKLHNEKLASELSSSEALLQSKEVEIESNNQLINSLRNELNEIRHERDNAVTNLLETEYNWESLNGELAGLKEANKQLLAKYNNLVDELDKMVEDGYFIPDGTQYADRRTSGAHNRHGHPHKTVIRTRVRRSNQMHQKKKRLVSDAGSRHSNDFSTGSEHFNEDEDEGQDHGNEYANLYASSHSTTGEFSFHNGSPLSNSAHRVATPRNTLPESVEESQQSPPSSGRNVPHKKDSLPLHLRPPSLAIEDSISSHNDTMKIGKSKSPRLNLMIKELSKLKTEAETLRISYQTSERNRKVEVSQLNLQLSELGLQLKYYQDRYTQLDAQVAASKNDSNHGDDMSTTTADLDSGDESKNKVDESSSLELHKGMVMEEIIKEILNEPIQDSVVMDGAIQESLPIKSSPSQNSLKEKDLTEALTARDGDELSSVGSMGSTSLHSSNLRQEAENGPTNAAVPHDEHNAEELQDEFTNDPTAQEDASEEDDEFERIDMLGYVLDWERVLQNSKATQSSLIETADAGIQYNEIVVQKVLVDKGNQVTEGDFEAPIEYYLETLFKGFVVRSRRFVPQHNIEVMSADRFNKVISLQTKNPALDSDGKNIGSMKFRVTKDSNEVNTKVVKDIDDSDTKLDELIIRSSRAHAFVVALNDFKNKQIPSIRDSGCAWKTINSRMVIRCLDLLLQTMHSLLSPISIISESHYPELLRAVDNDTEGYYSDIDNPTKIESGTTGKLMKEDVSHVHEKVLLMTAIASGAPRGVVNLLTSNNQTAAIIKYMNRSSSPRNIIPNVEHILDDRKVVIDQSKKREKNAVKTRTVSRNHQSDSSDNEENNYDQNKSRSRLIQMNNIEHLTYDMDQKAALIDSDSDNETGKKRGRSKSYGNDLAANNAVASALKSSFTPRRIFSANARASAAAVLTQSVAPHGPLIGGSFGYSADVARRKEEINPSNDEQLSMSIPVPFLPPQPARETTNLILLKPGNALNPISSAAYTSAIMQAPDTVGKSISIVGKVLIAPSPSIVVPAARTEPEIANNKDLLVKVERSSINGATGHKINGIPVKSTLQATRPTSASPSVGVFSLRTKRNAAAES